MIVIKIWIVFIIIYIAQFGIYIFIIRYLFRFFILFIYDILSLVP